MIDIDAFIQSMEKEPEGVVLIYYGYINKFIGIEITHNDENRFKVSQTFFIGRTISLLNIYTFVVKRQAEEVGKRAPEKLRAQGNHKHKTRVRLKKSARE